MKIISHNINADGLYVKHCSPLTPLFSLILVLTSALSSFDGHFTLQSKENTFP